MKKGLPLNSNIELLKWGPIPGKYYYVSDFNNGIFKLFPKKFPGFAWPKALFLFKENRIIWLNEFPELRKAGKKTFLHFILNKTERSRLYKKYTRLKFKLYKFETNFGKIDIKKLTHQKIQELGFEFYKFLMEFWMCVTQAELGNYGSDYFLESKLKKYIPDKLERSSALEGLISPEVPSFYQKEEFALLKTKNLKNHQRRYFWIKNNYSSTSTAGLRYFSQRKKKLSKNIQKNYEKLLYKIKVRKKQIIRQYGLPRDIMDISSAICFGISWQDDRKAEIFKYLHYKDIFARELSRRKKISFQNLHNLGTEELINSFAFPAKKIEKNLYKRGKIFGFLSYPRKIIELNKKNTLDYWKFYIENKIDKNIKQISGKVVSMGKSPIIMGKVRLIFNPKKGIGFQKGNILVTPMTSPDFIFLLKKASAIITDSGGLTSHAAIISRELNIPCIVDTKIATKVFKDGDMIEVDANKGIVKKLK